MLVTVIPFSAAHWISTTLYPVENSPIYFRLGQDSIMLRSISVLLEKAISASPIRSAVSWVGVLS